MNVGGGEAADQMVRMMLTSGEVAIRLTGSAMKNMLALSMALAKDHKRLSGKINMGKMLRETRDIRLFPMTPEQYKRFCKLAKRQKLMYSAIHDMDPKGDKLIDVVMPVTEIDRADLIFERILYRDPSRPPEQEEDKAPPGHSRPVRNRRCPRRHRITRKRRRRSVWTSRRANIRQARQKKIFGRNETCPIPAAAPLHPAGAGTGRRVRGRPWRRDSRVIRSSSRNSGSPLRPDRKRKPGQKKNDGIIIKNCRRRRPRSKAQQSGFAAKVKKNPDRRMENRLRFSSAIRVFMNWK